MEGDRRQGRLILSDERHASRTRLDRNRMLVLGIETTCDETAAAVVERPDAGPGNILSNVVLSQIDEHAAFGGVVPEIAARAHVEALDLIIAKAMAGCRRAASPSSTASRPPPGPG